MPGLIAKAIGLFKSTDGANLVEKIGDAFDKNFTSKRELEERAMEIQLEERKIDADLLQGQIDINKIEATHPHIFVAGWRPFIGWVSGVALAYVLMLHPLICWGVTIWGNGIECPPALNVSLLSTMITAMLGIGAMRSYDKKQGVDSKGLS